MKKKFLSSIVVLGFIIIIVFNINVALDNDYNGFFTSLSDIEILAFGGENSLKPPKKIDPKEGPLKITRVHCIVYTTTSATTGSSTNNNTNWGAKGDISAGFGSVGGSVGGSYNNGSSTDSNSGTATAKNVGKDYWADLYYCPKQTGSCTPYDPCF